MFKITVNPLLNVPQRGGGGVIYFNPIWGGKDAVETRGLFKTMVSVLYKELEYKVEKLKYKTLEVICSREDQNQMRTSSR